MLLGNRRTRDSARAGAGNGGGIIRPMSRDEVLGKLSSLRDDLTRFHVRSLSLFGSVARGEATSESDIDLLVEFDVPVGLLEFVRLRRHLEVALGARVDLATPAALRDEMRSRILAEAIRAA